MMEVSFLFAHGVKIYQFKAKDSTYNAYSSCLGNILKGFTFGNMKKLDYMVMHMNIHLI